MVKTYRGNPKDVFFNYCLYYFTFFSCSVQFNHYGENLDQTRFIPNIEKIFIVPSRLTTNLKYGIRVLPYGAHRREWT